MYEPSETRYETMPYNRCGKSGLRLPALSVGLWQNFGVNNDYDTMKEIILTAFDHGVTHFDLANNYGPEPGRAEINFGRIFKENLRPYRDLYGAGLSGRRGCRAVAALQQTLGHPKIHNAVCVSLRDTQRAGQLPGAETAAVAQKKQQRLELVGAGQF